MEDTIPTSELLKLILGGPVLNKYSVSCDTYLDKEVALKRIAKHSDLAFKICDALYSVSGWKDDYRYSAKSCGQEAYSALKNLCDDMLYWLDEKDAVEICRTYTETYKDTVES